MEGRWEAGTSLLKARHTLTPLSPSMGQQRSAWWAPAPASPPPLTTEAPVALGKAPALLGSRSSPTRPLSRRWPQRHEKCLACSHFTSQPPVKATGTYSLQRALLPKDKLRQGDVTTYLVHGDRESQNNEGTGECIPNERTR